MILTLFGAHHRVPLVIKVTKVQLEMPVTAVPLLPSRVLTEPTASTVPTVRVVIPSLVLMIDST